MLALELLYIKKKHPGLFERRDTRTSLWMMIYVVLVDLLLTFLFLGSGWNHDGEDQRSACNDVQAYPTNRVR